MTDSKAAREKEIRASVEALFRRCEASKNPVLAYSRACSKVGYLARDGVRRELHYLESALNERKHALLMGRYGDPEKAKEHNRDCGEYLRSFQRAVRAELAHPRDPISTPKLRERIHQNLEVGQWSRAGRDLDDLMRRRDIGKQLPALGTYSQSWNLTEQQFAVVQDRIEQCNAKAYLQEVDRRVARPAPANSPSFNVPRNDPEVVVRSVARSVTTPSPEPTPVRTRSVARARTKDSGLER